MEIFHLSQGVYAVATLVAVLAYFATRPYQEPAMNYLATMLVASMLADAATLIDGAWIHVGRKMNLVSNAYGFIEIATVFMLYQVKLSPGKKFPFMVIAVALVIMQVVELVMFRDIFAFPGTTRAVFAIAVTILAILYFFKMIMDLPTTRIYNIPMFWINIGMLVYFTGNFFLFMIEDYLVSVLKSDMIYYWSFHNIMGIISYLLIAFGLWRARSNGRNELMLSQKTS